MTEVHFNPRAGLLSVSGHAGAGEKGRDLVCAALSILCETAAALDGAETSRGEGWLVTAGDREKLAVLTTGFRLLARDYPQYVRYEEDGI